MVTKNEPWTDLITHSSTLNNRKAKFIFEFCLSSILDSDIQMVPFAARNATSQYSIIFIPTASRNEYEAMTFISSEKNKESDEAYAMHRNNMEKFLRRTDL